MTPEHENLITALAAASEHEFDPTPGCPQGRSRWHTPARLLGWGLIDASVTVTDIHRAGAALERKGLVARRSTLGVTRWTLTESGTGYARHLAKRVTPAPVSRPLGRADRKVLSRSAS